MSSTTSIHELPVDPAGGSGQSNVQLTANEPMNVQIQTQQQSPPPMAPQPPIPQQGPTDVPTVGAVPQTLDRESINSIVTGLQQASAAGVTQLLSRDMPTTSNHIVQDQQVDVNYVPPVQDDQEDYLVKEEDCLLYTSDAADE